MTEIQQQVEQFLNNTGDTAYKNAVHALLRKVVEECCSQICDLCKEGIPIRHFGIVPSDNTHDKGMGEWACMPEAVKIRRHFAWLLGTKEAE